MQKKILIVEDEPGLRLTLSDRLHAEGYEVETARDGDEGFRLAGEGAFHLILLDVMLPGRSGLDVCRDLRQAGVVTPILMLTARGQTIDKVLGLKLGADDYVTKPFEMAELMARVEALLRRAEVPAGSAAHTFAFGPIRVNTRRTEVFKGDERLNLSAKEFQLLRYFAEHPGETVSRETLLHEVWGYESTPTTRTIDVHVAWLRQKLEADPKHPKWIITVHGHGYQFTG